MKELCFLSQHQFTSGGYLQYQTFFKDIFSMTANRNNSGKCCLSLVSVEVIRIVSNICEKWHIAELVVKFE